MYKIILSGILITTSLIFTMILLTHYDNTRLLLISVLAIIIGGLTIGFFISAWSKDNMVNIFKESFKISFGIASAIYLSGYLFASIQGLF